MTLASYYFNQFTTAQYADFCIRLVVAFLVGGMVGLERSKRFKEAGIRTHIIVCVTAALIMLVSKYGFADLNQTTGMEVLGSKGADPARVAAQAVSGISFLCAGVISIFQNVIGIGVGKAVGLEAPYALLASAISMIGGHGAAGAYGQTFADMGYTAGVEVGAAAATFGLISGVLLGGPLARKLIVKYDLKPDASEDYITDLDKINASSGEKLSSLDIIKNVTALLVAMAVGTMVSDFIGKLIGMSFPSYVGAMFVAVIFRNLNESLHLYRFDFALMDGIGDVMLALYLSIALMSLKLWDLLGLLGGVLMVVLCQVIFMALISYFVVFRILGSNYDAAVMCAGLCGHGLGATPTAIVNMTAVKDRYGMSRKAFMIVPIVGAFLVDIIYQPQTIAFIKFFVAGFNG